MALVSPGVEVTIIDESTYVPAATNSVPFILLATAQNKISGAGAGVAPGTLAANANKVYLVTSQRDLAATFGNPFFYKTSTGTPINGYELNEYGLLAANSVLGITNRAYIMRADVDLAALTASLVRPTGSPADGTYWFDVSDTDWGIFEWNATTAAFTVKTPLTLIDASQLTGGTPSASIGNIGDYAVVVTNNKNPIYFKNYLNDWVLVGSKAWMASWPTITGANSVSSNLTTGNVISINGFNVSVPSAPNNTLLGLVSAINAANISGVSAGLISNKLIIYADSDADGDGSSTDEGNVVIGSGSTAGLLTTLGISTGTYFVPALQQSYSAQVPVWRSGSQIPRPTGSIWNMLTAVNQGLNAVMKTYDGTLGAFVTQSVPVYFNDAGANAALDPIGGGRNIPIGTIYLQYNTAPEPVITGVNNTLTFSFERKISTGPTVITGGTTTPTFTPGDFFSLRSSQKGTNVYTPPVTVTMTGTTAADFAVDVSAAGVEGVSTIINSDGSISLIQDFGGIILLTKLPGGGDPIADAGFNPNVPGCKPGINDPVNVLALSPWAAFDYQASATAPDQDPVDGTPWYYSATNQIDIMIQAGSGWQGYRTVATDIRGFNLTLTDPNGPIVSPTAPTQQSDGTELVYGDLWIDIGNLELYPVIKRWEPVLGVDQWVTIDNTDQTTTNGVLFADARWAANGTTDPISDNIPSITSLLTSNYLDIDAPDYTLYPTGMLLFNTRRSGFNVKSFRVNYFNGRDFAVDSYDASTSYVSSDKVLFNGLIYVATANTTGNAPTNPSFWSLLETNAWVTSVGNRADGSPYMGRLAQRQVIIQALKSAIDTSDTLREEQLEFNLIACPQYPELMINMVRLNNERNNTAFIVGDTPLRLAPSGTEIQAWATDAGGLGLVTGDGLTTSDPYLGVFYPSCQTTDLTGSPVVQPPSHMMLRTIVRSDEVAFPWLAPAGVRRGVIDNASTIGYINGQTGEFTTIATGQGLRDTLYENKINPITFIPGVGITNYGNKTESAVTSALDRINVARLVAYIRARLTQIGKTFVFEPNDQITRNEITNAIDGLMIDLVAKRGIYDYLVVCDLSNNTPARIDRNELYVDIAIEPVKAVEFIYIPVRIKNTGEIAAGNVASSQAV
jgi:hypothetical protein